MMVKIADNLSKEVWKLKELYQYTPPQMSPVKPPKLAFPKDALYIEIKFANCGNYNVGTDVNIPILQDNVVIGFVKDVYEDYCFGYLWTKFIDIVPGELIDDKVVSCELV